VCHGRAGASAPGGALMTFLVNTACVVAVLGLIALIIGFVVLVWKEVLR
jgi:hypothetical protein